MSAHGSLMHNALQERKRLLHYGARYALRMSTPNQRLRKAREDAGFVTATDAALALGMPRATYIGHENGHRGFPASRAPQYARKFKVSEEWLLYGKGEQEGAELETRISLTFALPNAAVLTAMFEGLLELIHVDPDESERAQTLARHFPDALALAASQQISPASLRERIRATKPRTAGEDQSPHA